MGCTQSKSTNEAVIDGGKASSLAPVQSPEETEVAELAASHTVSSDDHDVHVVAGTTNEGAAEESLKTKVNVLVKDETSTTENSETNDKLPTAVASLEGTDITTTVTTPKRTVGACPSSPKRSPRRSARRRSNSSGVNEMAAMGEEGMEEAPKQVPVEPLLQPVVPKKVASPPLEVEKTQQADRDNEVVAPKKVVLDDLLGLRKEAIAGVLTSTEVDSASEGKVATNDSTPEEEIITPVKSKQEFTPIQRNSSVKQKYCAGCFMEETIETSGAFKVCAKCKVVSYCGKDCQVRHWKVHKKACCKSSTEITNSQLQDELSNSPSSVNSNGSFIEVDAATRKSSIHDDAVRELEAVLRRLRSEESESESTEKPAEEAAREEGAKLSSKDDPDPIETAREAILDEAVSEMLDGTTPDVIAPRPPSPVADENTTPILQVPQVRTCVGCNSEEKANEAFKSCAKCRVVFYCNRKCQKGHWKEHKKVCCKSDPKRASLLQVKDTSLNPIQAS